MSDQVAVVNGGCAGRVRSIKGKDHSSPTARYYLATGYL